MDRRRIAARWGVIALTIALVAQGSPSRASVPVVFLDGRGHGHGVGLSQWGAESLARHGRSWQQILGTFYPGTAVGQASGPVRVAVFSSPNGRTTLQFPTGGEVRSSLFGEQAEGFPVRVGPGGSVRVRFDGRYVVERLAGSQSARQTDDCIPLVNCPSTTTTTSGTGPCVLCTPNTTLATTSTTQRSSTSTTARGTTTTADRPARTGAPVWAVPHGAAGYTSVAERARGYRGLLEVSAGAGPLRVINQIDVEAYLKGMAEVPSSWPQPAIAAQSVAARTWALRAMQVSGELCDWELCQVYVGVTRETAAQTAAVDATRGVVATYRGALASTVYSASGGGISATTFEGFGTPDGRYPYLKTVRYETDDPRPWRNVVSLGDVAARFGYPGTVESVRITDKGPSGRALAVTLDGTAGARSVDGRTFARELGLRSTLFRPTVGTADHVPPLPPSAGALDEQVLPDDKAALRKAARTITRPRPALDEKRADGVARAVAPAPHASDDDRHAALVWLGAVLACVTVVSARRVAVPVPYRAPYVR